VAPLVVVDRIVDGAAPRGLERLDSAREIAFAHEEIEVEARAHLGVRVEPLREDRALEGNDGDGPLGERVERGVEDVAKVVLPEPLNGPVPVDLGADFFGDRGAAGTQIMDEHLRDPVANARVDQVAPVADGAGLLGKTVEIAERVREEPGELFVRARQAIEPVPIWVLRTRVATVPRAASASLHVVRTHPDCIPEPSEDRN
jgi:hypothetical protein